jgi:DNA primase
MSAIDYRIISEQDLDGDQSGGFIRAYCTCHHDNRPPSLSINPDNGFGLCFRCGAQVLVREINPDAAARIERAQARIAAGDVRVRDPRDIARERAIAPTRAKPVRVLKEWQQKEIQLLRALHDSMQGRIHDERARAYIEGRGLSLETASSLDIGYIPNVPLTGKYEVLARWADHIVFPVYHPEHGLQFAGRNLHLWQPGMDENEHKALLEPLEDEKGIRRWRKTHAQGWFNFQAMETGKDITFVEGAFDALALIEAGKRETVAVVGTALSVSWLPRHLEHITLAFDSDTPGKDKCARTREKLALQGYRSAICNPPQDERGKDWSERYRRAGRAGLAPLVDEPLACAQCGINAEEAEDFFYDAQGVPFCNLHYTVEHQLSA